MMKAFLLTLLSSAALLAQTAAPAKPAAPSKPAAEAPKPERPPGLYVTIVTTQGTIVGKFFDKESPITVKNFVALARGTKEWKDPKTGQMMKRPLYTGLTFHRVIPGFMIQGGDPLGTGTGGTAVIPDEFNPALTFDKPGMFAMANAGPGTGSCQFFITEAPTQYLNGKHSIFAEVVEGMDVVHKIANVPRDSNDKPKTPVRMTKVTIERSGPPPAAAPAKPKPAAAKPPATK
jgi:peptidyl-prolyl cis-trans isomerase A (cyclophilin A)